ncbi:hypothetical protein BT96DRAFT_937974 [Gymnopus androsaceus JB14]|uniref:Uncharacterized protein n=1 Tax=Gymnopus androsaceus JB14 TaxID=1447944 RepID=A0A6A4HW10_9AGAR|nr:hypothetical protein BT96DRAFT_937974 [Gymnopus androsaceus JB14]
MTIQTCAFPLLAKATGTTLVSGIQPSSQAFSIGSTSVDEIGKRIVGFHEGLSGQGLRELRPFSLLNTYFVEMVFVDAAKEQKGKFVAVSPQTFLEKYLPEHLGMPQVDRTSFMKLFEQKLENAMYEPLIDALKTFLKPCWSMVNTSASLDPDSGFFNDHNSHHHHLMGAKFELELVATALKSTILQPCFLS